MNPAGRRIWLAIGAGICAALACNVSLTAEPTEDVQAVQTAVAGTLVAQLTQSAAEASPVPGATESVSTPEDLPTPTITFTPTPADTPTPSVPMVSVSVNTNCRYGPGAIYDYLGALLIGETAEIVGRDPGGNYWFIRNPDNPSGFCWLWGEYAQPVGNWASLPILTPPPSPTPTYTLTPTSTYTPTYTPTP